MYIKRQFQQNQFVLYLMEQQFEIISTTRSQDEYLLERKNKSSIEIVHVSLKQHDWKRDLEQHIIRVQRKYKEIKTNIFSKNKYHFYHIFIVDYPPVDDWTELISSPDNVSITMVDEPDEWQKVQKQLELNDLGQFTEPVNPLEMEQAVYFLKNRILMKFNTEQEKRKKLFEQGKPFWTYVLLVINVIMYGLLELNGGSTSIETLLAFGAKYNLAIVDGEWWRIISSMFLHIGLPHIILNMMALYFIGTLVERIYGNMRFLIIYFLAGIAGGIASFAFNSSIAAGASGAIFGLFGALVFFGTQFPKEFFRTIGWNVIFVIGLNVVFGFTVAQIDNGAHIGGLIGGFIASAVVMFRQYKRLWLQIMAALGFVLLTGGIFVYGYTNDANHYNEAVQLGEIQQQLEEENYQEVVSLTTEILPYADQQKAELYFQRSYAHILLGNSNEAISDLKRCLELKPNFEQALYNLALLYANNNQINEAVPLLEKAMRIDPDNTDYQTLYEQLKQN
ncbi:rhomboid family intramembrane serine protease [Gracilibacillus oryzae]|uniref:Rhomboid family intramembrane serine protease n=1 Tax=Gracilibacillus oryzae TaxID=1672701 RepID=A0A7C8GRF1_9BACI|nr:rhomboid family intramembrane serine protease [Gracilibacillus oryzae]KAB8128437.1 rhomboid family intramembrane serine protease [Gracilibacillus oryzae]